MTTLEERAPLIFHTPTEREQLREFVLQAEAKAKALANTLAGIGATLAAPPVDMLAPSYWPERMGYLDELRPGDRALFAAGWRQVATFGQDPDGTVRVTFTDPDMDELVDEGHHAIRIQKLADEQEMDALHRRDTGGL